MDLLEGIYTIHNPENEQLVEANESRALSRLCQLSFDQLVDLELTRDGRRKLLSTILDYYRVHVEKFDKVKSVEVLETVLN